MSCEGIEPQVMEMCWRTVAPFSQSFRWTEEKTKKPVDLVGATIMLDFASGLDDIEGPGSNISIAADVELASNAAVGDRTLTVDPLSAPIPAGSRLWFGDVSVTLTLAAEEGAEELSIAYLSTAVTAGATAPLGFWKLHLTQVEIEALDPGTYTGELIIILASGDALVPRGCKRINLEVTVE